MSLVLRSPALHLKRSEVYVRLEALSLDTRLSTLDTRHVQSPSGYKLVKLPGGVHSVHSLAHQETFHPVIGPVAEAEALYVEQLQLLARLDRHPGEFVIWDVGLGAAANALTLLRCSRATACDLRLISFDHTLEPLQFALQHAAGLGYLTGF